jgi:hypothetical protein
MRGVESVTSNKYGWLSFGFRLAAVIILLSTAQAAFAAVENLDETVARKPRTATAGWGYSLLQNNANNYTWQPETLNYTDVTTGSEVWKLTSSPANRNNSQDIAITHWSANGKRLLFHSDRATDAFAYANGSTAIWMLSNTDGSRLKPGKNLAGQLTTVDKYPLWSPLLADVLYQGAANDGQATSYNVLYKVQVSDAAISRSVLLTITPTIGGGVINLKKAISGDGRKVQISYGGKVFPVTVYPEASKGFDTPSGGYNPQLNFDWYWGGTPTSWLGYHDQYITGAVNGADGVWNLLMPEGLNGPFWRARLAGSGTNGAPNHIQDRIAPYNWGGEVEPVNTVTDLSNQPSPWCGDGTLWTGTVCMDSPGHGAPDRWGRYLISADPNDRYGYGLSFLDMRNHAYYSTTSFRSAIHNINHPDWEAWSDWSIASGSPSFSDATSGPTSPQSIVLQKYNDATSQSSIVYTHPRYNSIGSAPYEANARPTQSPDGTKVLFNSTFLSASDAYPQIFWTVAYYPYPPEIKSAVKSGSNVRLSWDFNQGTAGSPNLVNPRTYATRGWPHDTADRPPSPREIAQFRIWSSDDAINWSPLGTTSYNNCSGTNECGTWTETAWTFDAVQTNNSTKYYAVTSLEHSGLESRALSNLWKVVLDAGGAVLQQVQYSSYPATPGGKSNFYTAQPPGPLQVNSVHMQAPASTAGQYTITWSAPVNKALIRYYNVYAADGNVPTTIQQHRVASVPASSDYDGTGSYKYIDWLGNVSGTTKYLVTSVDFQGNESPAAGKPSNPIGIRGSIIAK